MAADFAELTTLRLGGPIQRLVTATSAAQLADEIRAADAHGEPLLIVGGGSNLVVSDDGWPGVVVLVRTDGLTADVRDDGSVSLTVQAGMPWDSVVERTVREGWSGLATMSGIPGSTGATPVQNVGAYGTEVAEVITSLTVLDRASGSIEQWPPQRCGFGFRTSAFKHTDRYVVIDVTLSLQQSTDGPVVRYLELARRLDIEAGDLAPAQRIRDVVLELRGSKGMLLNPNDHDTWSVGSFFVNPFVDENKVPPGCPHWTVDGRTKLSAAWLIENAGFGRGFGLERPDARVAVSTKHTLALTNRGGGSTAELLQLAREIRAGVESRFGIRLRPEAHLVGVEL